MSYEVLALLLMIAGFALIVAEVFIPSGGLILVLCVIAFVSSIWCAYQAWWDDSSSYFWIYIASLIILIPGSVIGAFRFLEKSSVGDKMLLGAPRLDEIAPYQQEIQRLTALVGKPGFALTLMAPGGMVSVDGERLHAISEGTFVEQGTPIEVIGLRGTRIIVRPASVGESPSKPDDSRSVAQSDAQSETTRNEGTPFDFELPPS